MANLHSYFGITRPYLAEVVQFPVTAARKREAERLYSFADSIDTDPNRYDEAINLYKTAFRLDPTNALVLTNLGNVYYRIGRPEIAESHYVRALAIDPKQPQANYNLGVIDAGNEDYSLAVLWYEKAIAEDPHFADAHYMIALALIEVEQYYRARKHLEELVRLEPEGEWSDHAKELLAKTWPRYVMPSPASTRSETSREKP